MIVARVLGPAAAVVTALVVALGVAASGDEAGAPPAPGPAAVAITSDAPRFAALTELAAASDLVIRGTVVALDRGRAFGEPGGTVIESRLVTIEVTQVLAGEVPAGGRLLLEEAGWLDDGTPVVVDGLASVPVGTEAVWFLEAVPSGDAPTWIVTSGQGRYLVDGRGELTGVDDDAVVDEVEALGLDGLRAALAR